MIIKEITYFPYLLKFKKPFQNSSQNISQREVLIISLTDELGNTVMGECSPLPGYSFESFEEVKEQLHKVTTFLTGLSVPQSIKEIENIINKRMLFPSVKFGLEQCFLNLLVARDENFLVNSFGITRSLLPINAVFGFAERLEIISGIEKKISAGYDTFKLKAGRFSFDDDFRLVESIDKYFENKVKLRLDVNGKWNENDAVKFMKQLNQYNIEYIEEPNKYIDSNIKLAKKASIPVAVDESVQTSSQMLEIIRSSKVRYFILKPMVLDGIFSAIKLINEAEKKNKIIIISSSFESSIGLSALVFLASLTKHNLAHGLDTLDFFEKDIVSNVIETKGGKIGFHAGKYPSKISPH